MAGIFINYRRDDSPGVAGRLFDHLALKYLRRGIFMDVDAMKPGVDFARQLETQVSECRVLLAVIGPRWLDVKDQAGNRRLDNANDYVRIELASALKRDIPVIPILVDGAVMPSEDSLSDDLKPLARRHAIELRHSRFNDDADAIALALDEVVPRRRVPWALVGAGVAIVVVAAIAVLWPKLTHKPGTQPTAVVIAKPAPVNPPAASSPQAQAAAPATQSAAPAQKAAVPPAQPAAPANSATPAGLPPGTKLGEIMTGVAYRGSILRVTEIPADPASCQAACRAETHCVAWTYTQPKAADQPAHCSLKPLIPEQITDACCTSGIERVPDPEFREPPPIPAGMSGAVPGIELEGGTYRYFGGSDATPQGCQAVCSVDGQCLAWDYVRPGVYSTDARCFLKNKSSIQVKSACCIAGFEHQTAVSAAGAVTAPAASRAAAPASSKGPFVNTDLRGSSYRHFDLSAADVSLCQSACKADKECLSWTYVHPSQQNPVPHCWLKNKVPSPSANSCCTSGIERAEAP